MPAAAYGLATLDPLTLLLTSVVGEGVPDAAVPLLVHNEYAQDDFNKFADLAHRRRPVGRLSAATGGRLERSLRHRTILGPLGWGDELRAVFVGDGLGWGFACLHRGRADPAFSREDEHLLARLTAHVAHGLRTSLLLGGAAEQGASEAGPGLIELTAGLEVAAANDTGLAWLDQLEPAAGAGAGAGAGTLPPAIHAVLARLRVLDADPAAAPPPRLPVRARSGRWLVLHASHLHGPRKEGRTAVIIQPGRPLELAPLIAGAYGLSRRERDICLLVLHGRSTSEISARLHISANTVQEHLKSIFRKAGVTSRRELVGRVFLERSSSLRLEPSDHEPPPG